MEAIISTFHIDWKILVAQLVNFGLVAAVLWWFALKPLTRLMLERTATIEKGLADAKRMEEKTKELEVERAAILSEARTQAQDLLTRAEQRAAAERTQALAQAKAEVQKVVDQGKATLAHERVSMMEGLKGEVAQLVVEAASRVMGDAMDKSVDHKMVERTMKDMQAMTHKS